MERRGLVLTRMAGDKALFLAACVTALFATTVLAALVGYTGSVTRDGLRRTLADATFETLGTTIGAHVPSHGLTGVRWPHADGDVVEAVLPVAAARSIGTGQLARLGLAEGLLIALPAALTVPTLRGANRTFVEVQTGIGRPSRGGALGPGVDLALLTVAALAIWQLTRYGATGMRATAGIDPVIVSAPALGPPPAAPVSSPSSAPARSDGGNSATRAPSCCSRRVGPGPAATGRRPTPPRPGRRHPRRRRMRFPSH